MKAFKNDSIGKEPAVLSRDTVEFRSMRLLYLGPEDMVDHVRGELFQDWTVHLALDTETAERYLPECDAVLDAYMRVGFGSELLEKASVLKLIVTATTGADHIDKTVLDKRGIPLLTLRGQREFLKNITPAAEHSWLLLMACARGLRAAVGGVLEGEWNRNKFPGTMLRGRTIGIVGCGRIGQWMARYATAFGMSCVGFDPYLEEWPDHIRKADLEETLETADFVTIHVPLMDETRNLIGGEQLDRMKPGSVLINTSRGEIVDEAALLKALEEGRLSAAGLDVLSGEPDIHEHPLFQYACSHTNLVMTPHIGGYSPDALRYVLSFCCKRILDFFGEPE